MCKELKTFLIGKKGKKKTEKGRGERKIHQLGSKRGNFQRDLAMMEVVEFE
ncbi:hypothetical protein RO3G_07491 [Rhizopus delemar RA 99-880]|uniref:Uncharacterized protein n=1 Tax=Rhizopus delemar (strain RA 99-880 / ATCC MYA-4621 / FGSC 9543 / NRRL 43880) TaxID=246409 RepID=I1C2V6_RHIO9|nr:hypothetical protein RO3G_07491 [Rhizopus delemar RA 99-880]|eukprot:EIE82786.1 hypothetical protein RO3G_07491 [Rhizopus delemar RA 99-880]